MCGGAFKPSPRAILSTQAAAFYHSCAGRRREFRQMSTGVRYFLGMQKVGEGTPDYFPRMLAKRACETSIRKKDSAISAKNRVEFARGVQKRRKLFEAQRSALLR